MVLEKKRTLHTTEHSPYTCTFPVQLRYYHRVLAQAPPATFQRDPSSSYINITPHPYAQLKIAMPFPPPRVLFTFTPQQIGEKKKKKRKEKQRKEMKKLMWFHMIASVGESPIVTLYIETTSTSTLPFSAACTAFFF